VLENFWLFVLIGFAAQIIDGALGMAYGISSTACLLALGVSPAIASASVHAAEVVTTGLSGFSHWRLGNVDGALFRRLVIPGVMGGMLGAYLLLSLPSEWLKFWVAAYLLSMGIVIIGKAIAPKPKQHQPTPLTALGLIGGFLDAVGGGGWGPVVTSTLIARDNDPRLTIGSVNLAEFFVTLSTSILFVATLGITHWSVVLGLLVGGSLAAPLAALTLKKLPVRRLMLLVGLLISALSLRTLYLTSMEYSVWLAALRFGF